MWCLNKALFHSPKKEREIHLRYLVNAIVLLGKEYKVSFFVINFHLVMNRVLEIKYYDKKSYANILGFVS